MAKVILKNGKSIEVTRQQGHDMWLILNGELKPTPEQESFLLNVDSVKLTFMNAPDSYIWANLQSFIRWCKSDWLVDYSGNPVKPQNAEQMAIARKYGFIHKSS